MNKRLVSLLFFLVMYAALTVPAQAGILRTLGHAGAKIGKSTVHMVKDVSHDLYEWIL